MDGADCPDCGQRILLSPARVAQFLTCPQCDALLEVVSVDPLEFDWGYDSVWQEEKELSSAQAETNASCPECGAQIVLSSRPAPSQKVVCPQCAADLEVCTVDPLVLDRLCTWAEGTPGSI